MTTFPPLPKSQVDIARKISALATDLRVAAHQARNTPPSFSYQVRNTPNDTKNYEAELIAEAIEKLAAVIYLR